MISTLPSLPVAGYLALLQQQQEARGINTDQAMANVDLEK